MKKKIQLLLYGVFIVAGSGTFSYYVNPNNAGEFARTVKQQEAINKSMEVVNDKDYNPTDETIVFVVTYNELEDNPRSAEQQGRPDVFYRDGWVLTRSIGIRTNKTHEHINVKLLQEIGIQKEGGRILDIVGLKVAYRE